MSSPSPGLGRCVPASGCYAPRRRAPPPRSCAAESCWVCAGIGRSTPVVRGEAVSRRFPSPASTGVTGPGTPTGIVHSAPGGQDRIQHSAGVFPELRPGRHTSAAVSVADGRSACPRRELGPERWSAGDHPNPAPAPASGHDGATGPIFSRLGAAGDGGARTAPPVRAPARGADGGPVRRAHPGRGQPAGVNSRGSERGPRVKTPCSAGVKPSRQAGVRQRVRQRTQAGLHPAQRQLRRTRKRRTGRAPGWGARPVVAVRAVRGPAPAAVPTCGSASAARTGGCRRCGSSPPRRGCRCGRPRRTPHRCRW